MVACSALRRTHRRVLAPKGAEGRVRFVYLDVPREVLAERIAGRRGHFFPEELLDSQLDALEPPGPGDDVLVVDGTLPPDVLAARIAEDLLGEGERR